MYAKTNDVILTFLGRNPPFLDVYIDVTKAKNCSAGLVHSFGHLPSHLSTAVAETRSGTSSRRASHEQLTTNTLKSMMMSSASNNNHPGSERNYNSMDQSRVSGHYAASMTSSLGDLSHNGSSTAVGTKSPLSMSQDSLPHQVNGQGGQGGSNGSGGSGGHMPLTPSSSSSSLTGSRSEKKKKVRGFLKKIFN